MTNNEKVPTLFIFKLSCVRTECLSPFSQFSFARTVKSRTVAAASLSQEGQDRKRDALIHNFIIFEMKRRLPDIDQDSSEDDSRFEEAAVTGDSILNSKTATQKTKGKLQF